MSLVIHALLRVHFMSIQPNSIDNKRDSFRCPAPQPRYAQLIVRSSLKSQTLNVEIYDESAGGFGVFIKGKTDLAPSDQIVLRVGGEESLCEITHKEFTGDTENPSHRIGLKLIEDLKRDPVKESTTSQSSMSPLALAGTVFFVAMAGFLYVNGQSPYMDVLKETFNSWLGR